MSRVSEKFTSILYYGSTQSRSCFRCQKIPPVPFDGNFWCVFKGHYSFLPSPLLRISLFLPISTQVFHKKVQLTVRPEIHPVASRRFLLSTTGVITTRSNRMKFRLQLTAHWKCGFPKKNLKENEGFQRRSLKKSQLKKKKSKGINIPTAFMRPR